LGFCSFYYGFGWSRFENFVVVVCWSELKEEVSISSCSSRNCKKFNLDGAFGCCYLFVDWNVASLDIF